MSLERLYKALTSLGLSESEVKVYFYIATKGPTFARDIINDLPIKYRKIYRILDKLRTKGIIFVNGNKPSELSVLPFEDVLNMLIKQKEEQAQEIIKRKKELVNNWKKRNN